MTSNQQWHWSAFGKHPSSRDYFRLGEDHFLIKGFSDWVENGYQILISKKNDHPLPCAWRFWARGSQKENLVCGLIRDSSDSLGRPFPLLLIGTGPLKDCEKHWDLLPFAFEGAWSQMERLSTRIFPDLQHLGEEIERINPPQPNWSELASPDEKNFSTDIQTLKDRIRIMAKKDEIFIPFNETFMKDSLKWIHLYHSSLKTHRSEIVTTSFMGGTSTKTWLVFFRRPLVTEDFVRLWSAIQG